MPDIFYKNRAKKDLGEIDDGKASLIQDKIQELSKGILNHENVKLINIDGRFLWRLKIGGRGSEMSYRAIFDIQDGSVILLSVIHRDEGYNVV